MIAVRLRLTIAVGVLALASHSAAAKAATVPVPPPCLAYCYGKTVQECLPDHMDDPTYCGAYLSGCVASACS